MNQALTNFSWRNVVDIDDQYISVFVCIFTHRQSCEFLVVSVDPPENLLAVSLQLLQLFLDDGSIQRFTLLDQSVTLSEHQLNLPSVQVDLLLEGLRRDESSKVNMQP